MDFAVAFPKGFVTGDRPTRTSSSSLSQTDGNATGRARVALVVEVALVVRRALCAGTISAAGFGATLVALGLGKASTEAETALSMRYIKGTREHHLRIWMQRSSLLLLFAWNALQLP